MILHTSAIVAIVFQEPEAQSFAQVIESANQCRLSAGNYLDLFLVLGRQTGGGERLGEEFLRRARAGNRCCSRATISA